MLKLLIPCLIWLTSVHCHDVPTVQEVGPTEKSMMEEPLMAKSKRDFNHPPCPPVYSHPPVYSPPPVYSHPPPVYSHPPVYSPPVYSPPVYVKPLVIPKKEISYHAPAPAPVQYIHQPTYTSMVAKQTVTYVKPSPISVSVKPLYQPVYHQKPALSYAPIYQKPIYYAPPPMYHKLMYEPMPKVYLKKIEPVAPILYQKPEPIVYQKPEPIVYQKPEPIIYQKPEPIVYHKPEPIAISAPVYQPKLIQLQAPQIEYVKPLVHPAPAYHPPSLIKSYPCP